jgi:hypothetical protein
MDLVLTFTGKRIHESKIDSIFLLETFRFQDIVHGTDISPYFFLKKSICL